MRDESLERLRDMRMCLQNWVQVPVGEAQEGMGVLAEVWGVVLCGALRCSCPALCVGWKGTEDPLWDGGEMEGKGKLY